MAENSLTSNQYLTFMMGEEQYAIPVIAIREVLVVPRVTRIPRMPAFMKGVVNLRGSVVPVLDLKLKFGIGETMVTDETSIIVLEFLADRLEGSETMIHLGIFADTVKKVVTIDDAEIGPPPKIGSAIETAFIVGMGRVDDQFVIILNTHEILSERDLGAVAATAEEE